MIICKDCRNRSKKAIEGYICLKEIVCLISVKRTDPVTGIIYYNKCDGLNRDGNCSNFQPSIKYEFKSLVKSILKVILNYFDLNKGWYGKQ